MLRIIQKRKIWYSISAVLVGLSIVAYIAWGLNLSIDFTGGSLLEVSFSKTVPAVGEVQTELVKLDVKSLSVQPAGDNSLVLRFQNTDEAKHQEIVTKLTDLAGTDSTVEELRFEAVGPSIGKELANNARTSIIIVILSIIAYVAWAFRHVSRPVASWKYGLAAVIALVHDVIIVIGVFSVLGHFYGIEVNSAFVAALLTVLGYSVNDTIVVFDRVRERLPKSTENFEGTINTSLNQTIVRSINTSLTVLFALLAIIIYGGESIRYFALALFIGIFFGTYSSIFLASPLLLWFEKLKKKA
ncbi:protein translocase subunit SecF [Candidatus Falkowbacteria bacterium CG10_big_fil_rev_8_21_14_0_10_37_14]|uniref:Protein-export membrane protein SecF n=1 Tax=Candidatus Falkowbacteria bacterium CG10_big_fil_rev_8_21_14_0_10_37_14 TaxID=1974561 RepID=A0A2M6WT71_9BACT|nr:protein translocase subunit SecF [Candidatus Falkowbacteria bacterium]PIT95941.1 MAG: protein translocase subunit SecF [Candidatus Falkowbacteria bacterium CG10_big_fil_rev_8_21_14_0_10_37_14]